MCTYSFLGCELDLVASVLNFIYLCGIKDKPVALLLKFSHSRLLVFVGNARSA
jgi:hypothetical protein